MKSSNVRTEVVVTDIQMRFGSMVVFMIKGAFASIPALIIVGFIAITVVVVGGILLAALGLSLSALTGKP